jgi:hypothetical protein
MWIARSAPAAAPAVIAAACVLLGVSVPSRADAADDAASQPAAWTPKELRFIYMAPTPTYSCDGLRDKVRRILLALGAREDLQLREGPCASFGEPTAFPGVTIKMSVLEPVAAGSVPARWQSIDLPPRGDLLWSPSDCELVEQIRQAILPLFATRNVKDSATCIPYQPQVGVAHLKAEVLIAVPQAATSETGR